MNDFFNVIKPRVRNQTLLIVEGNHEKNTLFWLLMKCFSEMKIEMQNVWIYGTNIYCLYDDIVKEYEEEWYDEDVDLPFIISKKENKCPICYKNDFTNIILVFDYERQDTYFSEDKIVKMQTYFSDAADVGQLYINYPMIESYQHLDTLPDPLFLERSIPAHFERGKWYKSQVRGTFVEKRVEFPEKLYEILMDRFHVEDEQKCQSCVMELLSLSTNELLEEKITGILQNIVTDAHLKTAKYQILNLIDKMGYVNENKSYWQFTREMFQQIILHNICKGYKLQEQKYEENANYRELYDKMDFVKILLYQNKESRDVTTGRIWVLNTAVLFVAEYNFALVGR